MSTILIDDTSLQERIVLHIKGTDKDISSLMAVLSKRYDEVELMSSDDDCEDDVYDKISNSIE